MSEDEKKDQPVPQRETASGQAPDPDRIHAPTPKAEKRPDGQHIDHWVLSKEERSKGWVRPLRETYKHLKCGTTTSMGIAIAETYAKIPHYYGSTFCCTCGAYFPVGEDGEFVWKGTNEKVGT